MKSDVTRQEGETFLYYYFLSGYEYGACIALCESELDRFPFDRLITLTN